MQQKNKKNPTTLQGNRELFQNPTDVPQQIIEAWHSGFLSRSTTWNS